MKKYIIIITSLIFAGFISQSCSDFLDRAPLDQTSRETYFRNETEIQNGLIATYRRLRSPVIGSMGGDASNGCSLDLEGLTDNAYTSSGYESLQAFAQGNISSTTGGAQASMWQH